MTEEQARRILQAFEVRQTGLMLHPDEANSHLAEDVKYLRQRYEKHRYEAPSFYEAGYRARTEYMLMVINGES